MLRSFVATVATFIVVIFLACLGNPLFAQDQSALAPTVNLSTHGETFQFDGVGPGLDLGTSSAVDLAGGDFTVHAWVRFASFCTNVDSCDEPIVTRMAAPAAQPNEHGWHLMKQKDQHFWFCLGGGDGVNGCSEGTPTTVMSRTIPAPGVWYDVTAVKASSQILIYVNGVLEGTSTPGSSSDASDAALLVGAGHDGSRLKGDVAEVQLYRSALSASLVQALYESSKSRFEQGETEDGLVAYWPFDDGSTLDFSGNHNDGEAIGAKPTTDRFGRPNQAYLFDGNDDYIAIANSPSLQIGTGDYTIAAWIRSNVPLSYGRIFSKGSFDCVTGYMMRLGGTKLWLENARDGACHVFFGGRTIVADGAWHFIVGVVDRDVGAAIYVDGAPDAMQMINTSAYDLSNDRDPTIGVADKMSQEFFSGKIDDVRIYSKALSALEVRALYNTSSVLPPK